MRPVICMVTETQGPSVDAATLVARAAAAVRGGVHLIQVRQPAMDGAALLDLVHRCLDVVRGTPGRVIVNDRLDVALAAGAHGVHLRARSMPAHRIRGIVPPGFLIGRSVHGADEARAVTAAGGLDYLIAGTILPTPAKPGAATLGLDGLRAVVQATTLPVLAIGGMTEETAARAIEAGAAGIAAIRLFAEPAPVRLLFPEMGRG